MTTAHRSGSYHYPMQPLRSAQKVSLKAVLHADRIISLPAVTLSHLHDRESVQRLRAEPPDSGIKRLGAPPRALPTHWQQSCPLCARSGGEPRLIRGLR